VTLQSFCHPRLVPLASSALSAIVIGTLFLRAQRPYARFFCYSRKLPGNFHRCEMSRSSRRCRSSNRIERDINTTLASILSNTSCQKGGKCIAVICRIIVFEVIFCPQEVRSYVAIKTISFTIGKRSRSSITWRRRIIAMRDE